MAYTDEARVRERFQASDVTTVPSALVAAAIEEAHAAVLRRLDPAHATEPPAPGVVLGETLLAGACLLRALASGDAVAQQHVAIGGQRIEAGDRFAALLSMAAKSERRGWETLAPYLAPVAAHSVLRVTGSRPVLGGEDG